MLKDFVLSFNKIIDFSVIHDFCTDISKKTVYWKRREEKQVRVFNLEAFCCQLVSVSDNFKSPWVMEDF